MLMGQLKSFSLESLLQICYNESNTGAIEFFKNDILCGQVGFINGSAVYAEFLTKKGIDAIKQISLLQDIDFKYNDNSKPNEKNVESDINFLTIECTRFKDESLEYISQLTDSFSNAFNVKNVSFYDFDSSFFTSPSDYTIRYYEALEDNEFSIVYIDKKTNLHIKLEFESHVPSDSVLVFMQEKGLL